MTIQIPGLLQCMNLTKLSYNLLSLRGLSFESVFWVIDLYHCYAFFLIYWNVYKCITVHIYIFVIGNIYCIYIFFNSVSYEKLNSVLFFHLAIRSGDYYMFDDADEEELDLILDKKEEKEESDEDTAVDQQRTDVFKVGFSQFTALHFLQPFF